MPSLDTFGNRVANTARVGGRLRTSACWFRLRQHRFLAYPVYATRGVRLCLRTSPSTTGHSGADTSLLHGPRGSGPSRHVRLERRLPEQLQHGGQALLGTLPVPRQRGVRVLEVPRAGSAAGRERRQLLRRALQACQVVQLPVPQSRRTPGSRPVRCWSLRRTPVRPALLESQAQPQGRVDAGEADRRRRKRKKLLAGVESVQVTVNVDATKSCHGPTHQRKTTKRSDDASAVSSLGDNDPGSCSYCSRAPHTRSDCPARQSLCNYCKKKGHFADVCCARKRKQSKVAFLTAPRNPRD